MIPKNSFFLLLFFISFLPSEAQISFAPYFIVTPGAQGLVLDVDDLNNDGLNDVVMIDDENQQYPNFSNKVMVYYQNNLGGLNYPVCYSYRHSYNDAGAVSIGDVNNDQRKDLVISFHDSIGIYFQNSFGTFNLLVKYYAGATTDAVKIGDINNDGLNDIIVSHRNFASPYYIRVFYQMTTGFTISDYPSASSGDGKIYITDMNNDNLNDVVFFTSKSPASGLHIYLQKTTGVLDTIINCYPHFYNTRLYGFGIGDLNNDGRPDAAASGYLYPFGTNRMRVFFQDSLSYQLINTDSLPVFSAAEPVEIADLDCDGKNEIIAMESGKYYYYEQDSLNQYYNFVSAPYVFSSHYNPKSLCVADINNDGKRDLVTVDDSYGLVIMLNTTTLPQTVYTNLDTIVSSDTVFHINKEHKYYYFKRTNNADTTCNIIRSDSLLIKQIFSNDTILIDSIFVKTTIGCNQYFDTIKQSNTYFSSALLSVDSLLIYTQFDTILTPFKVYDTLALKSKFFTDTVVQIYYYSKVKTLESSSGCSIIQKDVFAINRRVIIDSLRFDSLFMRNSVTCSITYYDTVFKQIAVSDSKLLSVDTTFFSTSIDTLLSASNNDFKVCNLLKVYPLPTEKNITLELSDPCFNYYGEKSLWVEIYDVNARLIFSNTFDTKQLPLKIDLSNYANSIYCLRASVDKDFCIKKVIKEK